MNKDSSSSSCFDKTDKLLYKRDRIRGITSTELMTPLYLHHFPEGTLYHFDDQKQAVLRKLLLKELEVLEQSEREKESQCRSLKEIEELEQSKRKKESQCRSRVNRRLLRCQERLSIRKNDHEVLHYDILREYYCNLEGDPMFTGTQEMTNYLYQTLEGMYSNEDSPRLLLDIQELVRQ